MTSLRSALHWLVQRNNLNMLTEDDIKNALRAVKYPGYNRDIVSFGLVKQIAANDGAVSVSMQLTTANPDVASQITPLLSSRNMQTSGFWVRSGSVIGCQARFGSR